MSRHRRAARFASIACVIAALGLFHSPGSRADDLYPPVSPDGLQLQKRLPYGAVYVKQGATFSQYRRLAMLDCFVDFAKNWQRNYNEDVTGIEGRVTQSDIDRIKKELAAEFRRVFTKDLQSNGGYEIVDVAAPDVLVIRPAILNLVVAAPEIDTAPPMSASIVASAGQMTLYLELWDSTTNTLLARVVDTEADQGDMAMVGSSVANKAAADRILNAWAERLRKRLDEVRAAPSSDATSSP
jgi:Protein of unknown function (DUF3313)